MKIATSAGADRVTLEAKSYYLDPVEFRGDLLEFTLEERHKMWLRGELSQDARTPLNTPGYQYPT